MRSPSRSLGDFSTSQMVRIAMCCILICSILTVGSLSQTIRFATFNASLNRRNPGDLISDLAGSHGDQGNMISRIICKTNPDILLINEFDYDAGWDAAEIFRLDYLTGYDYMFVAPSNTGIPSGYDLDNDNQVGGPGDALGWGYFEGQYGMVLYSKYPIVEEEVRTFQSFLWADMPGALLPDNPNTTQPNDWYSPAELAIQPLSSKSHWDIPIAIGNTVIHVLASHPTPPLGTVNIRRNYDEIRFWADYVTPGSGGYIYDDAGSYGGLDGEHFVIMGDLNADPNDGDSHPQAVDQLLNLSLVNAQQTPNSQGAIEQAQLQKGENSKHKGNPAFDTADFRDDTVGNLRVDYVLPSIHLMPIDAGVFWPTTTDPLFPLTGVYPFPSSDHRLVWVDIVLP